MNIRVMHGLEEAEGGRGLGGSTGLGESRVDDEGVSRIGKLKRGKP